MATNNNILTLDEMPTDYAYEDYLSALLMTKGRYYLGRSIKKNTPGIGDELLRTGDRPLSRTVTA